MVIAPCSRAVFPRSAPWCPESLVPSLFDPQRAPEGKHALYLWQLAPSGVGEEGMDWWKNHPEEVERFARDIREHFFSYTTNLSEDNVMAYKVWRAYRLLQRVERETSSTATSRARAPICSRVTPIARCPRSASSAR